MVKFVGEIPQDDTGDIITLSDEAVREYWPGSELQNARHSLLLETIARLMPVEAAIETKIAGSEESQRFLGLELRILEENLSILNANPNTFYDDRQEVVLDHNGVLLDPKEASLGHSEITLDMIDATHDIQGGEQ